MKLYKLLAFLTQDTAQEAAAAADPEATSDSNLHLVMETTCDSMPATPTTPSTSFKQDTLSRTPTSSAKKPPRRVAITTLSKAT